MLPSLVARAIEEGLQSYIRNEFVIAPSEGFRDEAGRSPLDVFLDAPHALTKGPWLELSLPFKQGGDKAPPFTHLPLAKIKPGFRPYRHQQDAFERLAWANSRSTIVATGTGSGKTECFLLPILDWCLACGKPGIKAILIYPMNALATDQSRRIESLLESIEKATGRRLRAGLYTGESAKAAFGKAPDAPASPWLIEERAEIRRNPPDILHTNYKMLDFLLMRPEDQGLWEGNGPEVMKYLVVDELHTFDGAQGTDLSCLIRRLRDRLHLGDALTAVGTSATIGGSDSIPTLCRYASDIFATAFEPKSVIEEDRLSAQELLDGFGPVAPEGRWPSPEILEAANAGSPEEYFAKVIPLWFDGTLGFSAERWSDNERLELGRTLGQHLPALAGFRRLVEDVRGVTELSDLADRWMRVDEIMEAGRWCDYPRRYVEAVIDSLVAMVAFARNDAKRPFLNVRAQLWVRTLSRAVASVAKTPKLALAADLPSLTDPLSLPLVGCRDCSRVAWGAAIRGGVDSGDVRVKPDLSLFYQCWFSEHRDTALLYPVATEESFTAHRARVHRLCPKCGRLEGVGHLAWSDLARDEAEEDGGDADAPATAGDVLPFAQGLDQARDYWPKLFGRDFPQPAGKDRKCFGEAAMNRLLTPRSTNFEWLVDWLSDPFGFETGMREAVRFAALTLELHSAKDILLRNGALPAEWPRPLLAAQPEAGERKLWLRDPSPALGFAFAATFGARVDPRTNAKEPVLAAAIRIDSEPFSGPALTGSAAKRDLWAAFWQSANALQFAGRAWITTTAVESEAIFTQFFTPEVGTVAPTGVATDGLEADWTEILDELGSDEAFFGNLLPAAQAAAGRRLLAPDDIVDGVPGAILTDGQGLAWKAGGLRVFLFAAEDLIDPAAPLRAPEETASEGWIALTTAAPGWLDKLARHLAQAS